ncbi:hypothetical protein Q3G72_012233 [Acer saccharum]|nr:hypothetical protein Q3G72_012233 [Acer saccharum]
MYTSKGAKSICRNIQSLLLLLGASFPLLIMSQDAASSLKEANTRNYCYRIRVKGWSYVKKILTEYTGHWLTFVLWIISISLDPFICYVPSIQDEEKLLIINSSLLIGIWVLYWSLLIYRISISFCENKRKWQVFNQAESIALLFSNVLLYSLVLIPKMEIRAPIFSVVLGIFLVVYLVERFRRWSDTSLLHLCDCIKPVVYDERTHIVREGDPINEMLFVLHGKLWNFSSAASSTNNVPPHDWRKEFLKDGDFWGEEIVNWVQDESSSSSSSDKLISQTTIQALTNVEAFVLRIDDLKKLFNEKAKILQSQFRKRKKRDRWIELLTAIRSNREQTPPGDQLTGPENV